jgi:NAD(P)-dependent dehydrogenase (short-subunit alcohol dehydrogenase family)
MKGQIATDRVVMITGASSGIGWATAAAFAAGGARVVLAARDATRLQAFVDAHPARREALLTIPTDVTRDDDVQRLVEATVTRFGRIDILVNNAGLGMRAALTAARPDDVRRLMEVNFFGALRCLQAVVPVMQRQAPDGRGVRGQVVNVGSVLSMLATANNGIYCASKFALRAVSDAARLELRSSGIDVILIMPGYIDTPFFDRLIRYDGPARVSFIKGQPPARVADAILRACARRQREVTVTMPAKLGVWTKRFAPRLLDWSLARFRH